MPARPTDPTSILAQHPTHYTTHQPATMPGHFSCRSLTRPPEPSTHRTRDHSTAQHSTAQNKQQPLQHRTRKRTRCTWCGHHCALGLRLLRDHLLKYWLVNFSLGSNPILCLMVFPMHLPVSTPLHPMRDGPTSCNAFRLDPPNCLFGCAVAPFPPLSSLLSPLCSLLSPLSCLPSPFLLLVMSTKRKASADLTHGHEKELKETPITTEVTSLPLGS